MALSQIVPSVSAGAEVQPGELDLTFDPGRGPNGVVRVILPNPDGSILVAGAFDSVDTRERSALARLAADGRFDERFVSPALDGEVLALAQQIDGKIVLAGRMTLEERPRSVVRLNGDGSLDSEFKLLPGADGPVWGIALQPDGKTLIAGDFTAFDGQPRSRLARLNRDGSLDLEFRVKSAIDASLRAVKVLADGKLLIAGNFTSVDGVPRQRIARLNADGSLDATFDPGDGADSWISVVAVQTDGAILIGGSFRRVAGTTCRGIARLDPDGKLDRAFNSGLGANDSVSTMVLQRDGKILVGGGFKKIDGIGRKRIARLYPNGAVDPFFEPAPGANDWVETIALQADGRILIGGNFSEVDQVGRERIARLEGGDPPPRAPQAVRGKSVIETRTGADVKLRADLPAIPQPSYRWFFNGVEIAGANRDTLRLRNVVAAQAGDYKVTATNSFGMAERSVAAVNIVAPASEPGETDTTFDPGTGPDHIVYALAVQSDARVLIGGAFRYVENELSPAVARLLPDGAVDRTFHSGLVGLSRSLIAEPGGKTLVGGFFQRAGQIETVIAAQLNSDGGVDPGFQPVIGSGYVSKILRLTNQKILVGGDFLTSQPPRRAATFLNPNGSIDSSIDLGFPAESVVYAINREPDNQILLGGFFTTVRGVSRNNIVRLNEDGTVDPNFNPGPGPNGSVRAMALQADGKIIIAGRFTKVGLTPKLRIARLNPDGTLDPSFDAGPFTVIDDITSVAIQSDGKVLIGATFNNGSFALARLEKDGAIDGSFRTITLPDRPEAGPSAVVQAIELLADGKLLIGGDFKKVNGVTRTRVARLFDGEIAAAPPVVVSSPLDRTVFAGADVTLQVIASSVPPATYQWRFNSADLPGETRDYLTLRNVRGINSGAYSVVVSNPLGAATSAHAILNVLAPAYNAGAPDINFYTGLGPNDRVNDLAVRPDGKIVIVGAFTDVKGVVRGRIARLNPDGTLDLSFSPPGTDGPIFALALQNDGAILIGGTFSVVNGITRSNLARLTPNGALDLTFNNGTGPNGIVNEIALQSDGAILVGGGFTEINAVSRRALGRLLSNGTVDPTFTPNLQAGSRVHALAVQSNNAIVVGGFFQTVDGVPHLNIARLLPDGRVDPSFNPQLSNGVEAIAIEPDGQLLIGGYFARINGVGRDRLARLNPDGTFDPAFNPQTNEGVFAITLQPDGKILIGGNFDVVNLVPHRGFARLNSDGTLDLAFETGSGIAGGTLELNEYGELGEFFQLPEIRAIALVNPDTALIGGNFTTVGEAARPHVARVFLRDLASIDSDNDGLPDSWEEEYGLNPHDPVGVNGGAGDFDGDGRSNRLEYVAGTDPRRADSIEPKLTISHLAEGIWGVRFLSQRGRNYRIYFTSDLSQPFVPITPTIPGTGSEIVRTDNVTQTGGNPAQRFYKLEVQLASP